MLIAGEWFIADDGLTRPVLNIVVRIGNNQRRGDRFLIDSGADRTVFSRSLLTRLETAGTPPPAGEGLLSAAGAARFVLAEAVLELSAVLGQPAIVRGEFAAFTDESALDMSVLGRDVLDNFDVFLSRRRDEVLLLAGSHLYQVASA
jgi:hypothetical protein